MSRGTSEKFKELGIVGAGTMGSGIALMALRAGLRVTLCEQDSAVLDRAKDYIRSHLARKGMEKRLEDLKPVTRIEDLAGVEVVIEAIVEDLESKRFLFRALEESCTNVSVLASNTSTLPITAIASGMARPHLVCGMHFFNPAPVLPLVELIRGALTDEPTLARATALATQLGKTPVVTADTPGFIVNRVARPFYGEPLRLVTEQAAGFDAIDEVVQGAGFRMGPFRLMDLIGIDINFTAMSSMYEQTFGDSRYRPSLVQLRKIQQNALGRKTGAGFYTYDDADAEELEAATTANNLTGSVAVLPGSWAPEFDRLCREQGYATVDLPDSETVLVIATAGQEEDLRGQLEALETRLAPAVPILCQCADITLHQVASWLRYPQRLIGFDGLFAAESKTMTLVRHGEQADAAALQVTHFCKSLGKKPVWIEDAPGLVVPRIVAMLANEAAFAVGEGVAPAATIDKAMMLGVNYPAGPIEWATRIGMDKTLDVLQHLHREYLEERYRPAPLLRKLRRLELMRS